MFLCCGHSNYIINLVILLSNIYISNKCLVYGQQRGSPYRRPINEYQSDDYHSSNAGRPDYYEDTDNTYALNFKSPIALTDQELEENKDLLNSLTKPPPVKYRGANGCDSQCTSCLASCNHIKRAKGANNAPLVQYLYLAVCAKGCKKLIGCLQEKYCLPVMKENPDYFIQCANSCPLFPIIPKVFIK